MSLLEKIEQYDIPVLATRVSVEMGKSNGKICCLRLCFFHLCEPMGMCLRGDSISSSQTPETAPAPVESSERTH